MNNDNQLYLHHIFDAIKNIESFTKNVTDEKFSKNKLLQDGVIRNLEIIGEATKRLDASFRKKHHNIEWKRSLV